MQAAADAAIRRTKKDELNRRAVEAGAMVKQLREQAGLSQRELATSAGLKTVSLVKHIERGRIPPWKGNKAVDALANALGVPAETFAIAPDDCVYNTGIWPEGGIDWLHPKLIDLGRREDPLAESGRPKIDDTRLRRLQVPVDDASAGPVCIKDETGKTVRGIRFLKREYLVPCKGDNWRWQEGYFYDPEDVAFHQLPYKSRPLANGTLAVARFTGRTCDDGWWNDAEKTHYERPGGRTYGTITYLMENITTEDGKPVADRNYWYDGRFEDVAELNRPFESYEVRRDHRDPEAIWSLADAAIVQSRRTDPKARKEAPGGVGKFEDAKGNVLKTKYGTCYPDSWAVELLGVSKRWLVYYRRHAHPGIGHSFHFVWTQPLLLGKGGGAKRRPFTCAADMRAAIAWEKRLREAGQLIENEALKGKDLADAAEVLGKLELSANRATVAAVAVVLAVFRQECPGAWTWQHTWNKQHENYSPPVVPSKRAGIRDWKKDGPPRHRWESKRLHVFDDFKTWLKRRGGDVIKLAVQVRKAEQSRFMPKAVAFLQFVLTHETGDPPAEDASERAKKAATREVMRSFRRFLNTTSVGDVLPPLLDPVPSRKIKEWARKARVEWNRVIVAKRALEEQGTVIEQTRTGWRLGTPLTVRLTRPKERDESEAGSPTVPSPSPQQDVNVDGRVTESPAAPRWDRDRRELWYGSVLCARYRRLPLNQGLILESFEEMNWPGHIDNPLPKGSLEDTLRHLRKATADSPIEFCGDGEGKGIIWRPRN